MPKTNIDEAKARSGFTDKLSTILKATYEYLKKSGTLLGTKKSPLFILKNENNRNKILTSYEVEVVQNDNFKHIVTFKNIEKTPLDLMTFSFVNEKDDETTIELWKNLNLTNTNYQNLTAKTQTDKIGTLPTMPTIPFEYDDRRVGASTLTQLIPTRLELNIQDKIITLNKNETVTFTARTKANNNEKVILHLRFAE